MPFGAVEIAQVTGYAPSGLVTAAGYAAQPVGPNVAVAMGGSQAGALYAPQPGDLVLVAKDAAGRDLVLGGYIDPSVPPAWLPALAAGEFAVGAKVGSFVKLTAAGDIDLTPASGRSVVAGATSVASLTSGGGLSGASGGVSGAWSAGSLSAGSTSLGGTTVSSLTIGAGGPTLSDSGGVISSGGAALSVGNLTIAGTFPIAVRSDNAVPATGTAGLRADAHNVVLIPAAADGYIYAAFDRGLGLIVGPNRLIVRSDNSNADPGGPWMRSDGSYLVINPRTANDLYLMWDSSATAGTTHVGQNANAVLKVGEGAGTLYCGAINMGSGVLNVGTGGLANAGATQLNGNLGVSGTTGIQALTTNAGVTHNSVGRLVFSGATMFTGGTTGTSNYLGITVNGTNYWVHLYT